MADETREEMVKRLKEEIGKLLEDKLPHGGSTIDEIERITEEIGQEIERRIEDGVTKQEGRGYVGSFAECQCGNRAIYKKDYSKSWQTLHCRLVIRRAYYHCSKCGRGFAPLDAALGLDRGATSLRVRDKIARVSAMAPFGRGASELEALCCVRVSAKTFERVIKSIRAWRPMEPDHIKLKHDNLGYFRRNRSRMHYDKYRARQLHIGSGIAESACKSLVQARLKQSGMRWSLDGAAAMLQLRRLWLDVPQVNFAQYAAIAH